MTHDGKAKKATLDVDRSRPVAEPQAVIENRKAQPFDRNVLSRLNPTLRSFTLDGKVSVVTG